MQRIPDDLAPKPSFQIIDFKNCISGPSTEEFAVGMDISSCEGSISALVSLFVVIWVKIDHRS